MKKFSDFDKAQDFVRNLALRSQQEWNQYAKSGKKPDNIPSFPPQVYRKQWKGWGDFLGTGNIANFEKKFGTYEEAKKIARNYKIHNAAQWKEFSKTKKRPIHVPAAPDRFYQNQGIWKGWGDFLGTGNFSTQNKEYMKFTEAKKFVHKLKLKNQLQWREFSKTKKRPSNIPSAPERVYKEDGWTSVADWLGKEDDMKKKESKKKKRKENGKN